MRKQKRKQRKSRINYYYKDNDNEIFGTTDDCCRTMINLFTVFNKNKNKKVFFDLHNKKKLIFDKENSLQYAESNNIKTYKYQSNIIKRKDFILLLACEE